MRRVFFLSMLVWLALIAPSVHAAVSIDLGESVVALNGPWKFHTGDDPRWAAEGFDDSSWETFDLTPASGSHDDDVGLKNYVPGWAAHGHRGYSGFAWYRTTIRVNDTGENTFYLVGPADVDDGYQAFFNGHLLGGIGDFTHNPPSLVSIQPRLFALPPAWWTRNSDGLSALVAFRVVLLKGASASASADGGGIHIAPLIGTGKGAGDHYRLQWLQTVEGYAVDTVQPLLFLALAIMALCLLPFDPQNRFYPWLSATLVLLAAARANQPLFFLWQFETIREFVLWRLTVVDALTFAAWTLAWSSCFGLQDVRWIKISSVTLAIAYLVARLLSTPLLLPSLPSALPQTFAAILQYVRYAFLILSGYIFYRGILRRDQTDWIALCSMVLGAIGLFASELSRLGVPGIWFPYGVGVSRTEYAYFVFDIVLFIYLLQRLWRFTPSRRLQIKSPS
ncbi:glycoside hydrolase [Rhodanobacter sp. MP7CTX1]|uniref:glycoside hydrolase n=1 Tax=Rhodanobacter sp. MP7CTX1 TaxID=2723084 RepID=UPI001615DEC5|nr:glycoside hydrolase [Rhodanobacter sp. MP7CTX1]MBB6185880.1 hypothetical protein [Rhodanobacter sp. MP7CTX1]